MQSAASAAQAKIDRGDFFARARARLTLEAPAGLADPDNLPLRGDHDADPVLKAIAGGAADQAGCGADPVSWSARSRWCS